MSADDGQHVIASRKQCVVLRLLSCSDSEYKRPQLPQTDPRDAQRHTHSVVHKGGRSGYQRLSPDYHTEK